MAVLKNRAKMSTSTTGTGTITLGSALSGYQSFAAAGGSNGDQVRYTIQDGVNWEVGLGTYTASGTTLSRTPSESSSSGSAINLSGNAEVFITAAAEDILQPSNNLSDLSNASTSRTNLGVAIGSDVQAYSSVLQNTTASYTTALNTKLSGIETGADVTDAANVNPLVDSHINVSSASSGQYLNWNGSDYAWGSIDTSTLMPKAGGTFTGDVTFSGDSYNAVWDKSQNSLEFADSAKATFGASRDLEVYHASDSSYIDEVGGGSLFIRTNGPNVFIGKTTGSEYMAVFTPDGAVSLRYDNATKLATTSTGIDVTGDITFDGSSDEKVGAESSRAFLNGNLGSQLRAGNNTKVAATTSGVELTGATTQNGDFTFTGASYNAVWDKSQNSLEFVDNAKATFGDSRDLQIYHDGNSVIKDDGGGDLELRGDNTISLMNAAGTEYKLRAYTDGAVNLYYDNAVKVATTSSGVNVTGNISNTSGDMTLDVVGDIILDADDFGKVHFHDGGTHYGTFQRNGDDVEIKSIISNADIKFIGVDGGGGCNALTLDMSDAGTAIFNHDAKFADDGKAIFGAGADGSIYSDGNNFIIDGTTTGIYQTLIQGTTGVKLRNNGGSGGYADGLIVDGANSASTRVRAQYGTTTRLETTSSGVTVTGTLAATAVTGDGSGLTNLPAAAASGVFYENDTNVSSNYTITSGKNAMSAGPITIDSGVTVTVPSGSAWTVVT